MPRPIIKLTGSDGICKAGV